jgi:4-aminobutyrate aminotransferase/(S)-3-amino-2-methylpropionate transaminase
MRAIELVTDRSSREPASEAASEIIHRCLDWGLVIIKAGLYDNVVRILVPLVIEDALLEEGLDILDGVVGEVDAQTAR